MPRVPDDPKKCREAERVSNQARHAAVTATIEATREKLGIPADRPVTAIFCNRGVRPTKRLTRGGWR